MIDFIDFIAPIEFIGDSGAGPTPPATNALLKDDGSSILLKDDGTSQLTKD